MRIELSTRSIPCWVWRKPSPGGVGLALLPVLHRPCATMLSQLTPPLPEMQGELWLLTHPDLRKHGLAYAPFSSFAPASSPSAEQSLKGKAPPEAGSQIMAARALARARMPHLNKFRLLGAGVDELDDLIDSDSRPHVARAILGECCDA